MIRLALLLALSACTADLPAQAPRAPAPRSQAEAPGTSVAHAQRPSAAWRRLTGDVRFFAAVDGSPVDVTETMQRIASGGRNEHRNDGTPFQNRERRLPRDHSYTEYVVPTPGVHGPGPRRIAVDESGQAYYTPDHYGHFYPVSRK